MQTSFFLPILVVVGFFVLWSIRVTLSLRGAPIAKGVIACVSIILAIACAIGAISDNDPAQVGLVVVFAAIHVGALISYAASHILARLGSASSSDAGKM